MKNGQIYLLRLCALAAPLALAACGEVKKDDGAAVEARARQRWDLLIKHEAEKAYDFLTPGFRQTITREKYAQQKNDPAVRWRSAEIAGHSCEADACTVTVKVVTEVRMPGVGKPQTPTLPTEEHWVRIDRTWYYLPDTRIKALPVDATEGKPAASPDASHPQR